jgi:putative ABC transport system permease protein
VASLREVDWARFAPNFVAVFADGPLRAAPQTFVSLVRVDDAAARGRLLRSVASALPNVSALDLAQVQQALETLVARVALGIRFMALFSLLTGAAVLFGAVAASRLQRVREAVLLKTLGATHGQVRQIALAEYLFLGTLATGVGLALAGAAGWALMRFVFDSALVLPLMPAAALAAGVVALTVAIGLWNSVAAFRRTPLEILRAQ